MSDPTDTHDEAAAEQPAAETPFPPRHFDAEEHLVNGSTDVTQQSPTMRLVPALADTTPAPLTAEQIAAGEQAALTAFGGPTLTVPAGVELSPEARASLVPGGLSLVTVGVDHIAPRPEPAADDVATQIATHGHALASPR